MAEIHGFVAHGFDAVADAFADNFARGEELGASFALLKDGELVVNLWAGFTDRRQERPWEERTIAPVYSTTKGIAAFVMAMLVERGALDYEAPVAAYWPEFAAHGKDRVTVGEALSHQAGLPGFPDPIDPGLWMDPPALSAALAALAPMWPPGEGSGYHPLTWGYLAGEIAQRATGKSLGTILREEVCAPAGIDFWIGTPESEHARAAEMSRPKAAAELGEVTPERRAAFLTKWASPDRGGAEWRRIEIPSANGHGNAVSVARLYALYAAGGRPFLSAQTYGALTRTRYRGEDRVLPFPVEFCAGIMRNIRGAYGPNPSTLGHSGWGGSCGFADPDAGLAGGYVMNRQSIALQGDERAKRLIDAVYLSR